MKYSEMSELVFQILATTGSGRLADRGACCILSNFLDQTKSHHPIAVKNLNDLVIFSKEASNCYLYVESGNFHFTAFYYDESIYPIGRSFYYKIEDLFDVAKAIALFRSNDIDMPLVLPGKLGLIFHEEGLVDRIINFQRKLELGQKSIKGLFEGRRQSNITDEGHFLNSEGCIICGNKDCSLANSLIGPAPGLTIGFKLCNSHLKESQNNDCLVNYLCEKFGCISPFAIAPIDANEHIKMIIEWAPSALNSKIIKVINKTITLERNNGYIIILRLKNPLDYGYMILDPTGKEMARFDSASHHKKIPYGPDHLHPDLVASKLVIPSFTMGSPFFDFFAILDVLKKIELRNTSPNEED